MKKIIGLIIGFVVLLSFSVVAYAWECESGNHNMALSGTESVTPTCTEPGKMVYVCTNSKTIDGSKCEYKETTDLPALGHDIKDVQGTVLVPASYEKKGTTRYVCKRCNQNIDLEDIPQLIKVTSITLSERAKTVKVTDGPVSLLASVAPNEASNKQVQWISTDESVAIVSQTGVVTLIKKGTATIIALAADGYGAQDRCVLTITDETTPSGDKYTISTEVDPPLAGTITGGGEYNANEDVSLKTTANKGYLFTGWTLDGITQGTSETLPTFKATKNAKYVAHFIKNGEISYTVTYRPGDAEKSDVYTDTKIENKDLRLKGSTYTKKGQVQIGWISADNTAYDLDGTYRLNSDITLYPKWAAAGEHTLTVYYNADCGNIKTGETLVKNGDTFKIKDDESATFRFTAITDYYTGSVVLNGVRQEFKDNTFTVPGKNTDQTMTVTFFSRFGNPATGDNSNLLLWSCLCGLSAAAVTAGVILKKKSKS